MGQSKNKTTGGRSSADLSKKVKYNANNIGDYPTTVAEKVIVPSKRKRLSDLLEEGLGGGSSTVETVMPEDGFAPNTYYNLGTITEDTTFLMAEGEEGKVNHYFWVFETGDDVPEITWPDDITMWENNKAPVIAANHHYEISVYDGVGMYEVIGEGGDEPSPEPSGDTVKVFTKKLDLGNHNIEYVSLAEFAAEWELTEEEMYDLTFGDWDAIRDNDGILHFRSYKHIRMNGDVIDGITTEFSGVEHYLFIYVSDNCSVWSNAND